MPADSFPPTEREVDRPRLLVVADQAGIFETLRIELADYGQLVSASDPEDALRRFQEGGLALVLLAVLGSGQDALDLAARLRASEASWHTPILFLVPADGATLSAEQAYTLPAVDYLIEPAPPVVLRAKVAAFVEQFQHQVEMLQRAEEVRLLAAEQAARTATEVAERRKDEFLAMLAHELRNPLAPLLNGLHILRLTGADKAAAEEARTMMERQIQHLCRLLDDLLDVSRITHGKIRLSRHRLDLSRLVRIAVTDRQPTLEEAGLRLTVETPPGPVWVVGDGTRLAQVLNNLLDNASKFTERGGSVRVRLARDEAARQAVLSVSDTGIGIEPEMLSRLFDVFAQADQSLERSGGGLGLGLALVRGLVELHGGQVQAASAGLSQGAEFTVRLPLVDEPAALSQRPTAVRPQGRPLRVLVVEDNRDAAESLRMLLELLGHTVEVAHTGPEGLQAAEASAPEVVLCDIGLPGLDGYGVAVRLRQNPATAGALLVAITGYGTDEDRRNAFRAGFDYHLTKPVEPGVLFKLLARPEPGSSN